MNDSLHSRNLDDIPEPFKKFTQAQKNLDEESDFIESSHKHMKKKIPQDNSNLMDILFMMLIFEIFRNNNTN